MYIKNKRNSSNIKVCSPFELSCKLKDLCFEIAYFSYTRRSGILASPSSANKLAFGSAKADQNPFVLCTPGILEICLNAALNQIVLYIYTYNQL